LKEWLKIKKYVQRMWRIHDVLFLDKENAEQVQDGKEVVKEVFVAVDKEGNYDLSQVSVDFFGRWIFTNEEEAQSEVDDFNN